MKFINSRVIMLMLAVILITSLIGCSSGTNNSNNASEGKTDSGENNQEEKVKLRFGHTWTDAAGEGGVFNRRIQDYLAENPHLELVQETATGEEFKTKIKVDLASNNTPDIFIYWAGESLLRPLAEADVLLDMDEYLALSENITADKWSPSVFDLGGKIDGVKYALPIEAFKGFFLYNKEIMDEYNLTPPTTYEEWKEVAKVLRENDIIPLSMGSQGSNPGHFLFNAISAQLPGGVDASENLTTSYQFDVEPFVKTAEIIDEMRQLEFFPGDTIANGGWSNSIITYNEKKSAMIYTYPWTMIDIKPEIKEASVLMPFPKMDGAVKDPKDFAIGGVTMSVVINKESFADEKKRKEIVKLADFLLADEMISELAETGMPTAMNVEFSSEGMEPFTKRVFDFVGQQDVVNFVKSKFPTNPSTEVFNSSMDELFAGAITPEEFIQQIQKQLDKDKK